MLEHIHQYYAAEKAASVYALPAGISFVLTGLLLGLQSSVNPLSKGLGTGLTVAGGLLLLLIVSNGCYNTKMIERLRERKNETDLQLQQAEIQRMTQVLDVSFRYALIACSVLITGLTWFALLSPDYYWKGISLSFVFFALALMIADTYNAKRNKEYLEAIKIAILE
ncbi:hypothetical protein SAMN05421823_10996 [Catalinimonas alkaloidigena]|uniref:DUF2721 domain-containing protein n=1 Tax=Catalinimonas alkaloidigena TaxID=1075417 RepID=A0A1G9P6C1_9BACT|nr:hypothetical protein [Catalinimonas alkaloidigena]SDL94358.1 hypothetical protein SAMN05421823_10996 [Catalinimonas alkaloidigena]